MLGNDKSSLNSKLELRLSGKNIDLEHFEHAWKISIQAISSTIFDFKFLIRAISNGKMVEHFDLDLGRAGEISSDLSQILLDPMLGLNYIPSRDFLFFFGKWQILYSPFNSAIFCCYLFDNQIEHCLP